MNMKSIKIQVKSSAFYKLLYLHPSVSFIISFLKLPICNSKQMDYLAHGLPLLTPPLCSGFCSLCSPPSQNHYSSSVIHPAVVPHCPQQESLWKTSNSHGLLYHFRKLPKTVFLELQFPTEYQTA